MLFISLLICYGEYRSSNRITTLELMKKKKKKFIYATLSQNIQSTDLLITCAT